MRITEEQGSYPGYAFYFRYKKPMNDQTNKPDWKVKITSNELSAEVSKDEIVYHGTNHTPAQFLSAINNRRKVYECWKKNFQK